MSRTPACSLLAPAALPTAVCLAPPSAKAQAQPTQHNVLLMPCGDIGQANVSACSLGFAPSQRAPSFTIDQAMEERNQSLGSL